MEMKRLEDKVTIITGSGAGIGKEIALAFAKEGAKVVIADFNEETLNQTVIELKEANYEALGVKVNVALEEDVNKMVDETVAKFGRVDIVVNRQGIGVNILAVAIEKDETCDLGMNVKVNGVMSTLR